MKISGKIRQEIALRQTRGEPLREIADALNLHCTTLSRLQGDASYQKILDDLEKTAHETARRKISTAVSKAIDTLTSVCELPNSNETITTYSAVLDDSGHPVKTEKRTVKDDPRKLLAKVQASSKLLDCYLHLSSGNDETDHTEKLLQQRQRLLESYGIPTPSVSVQPRPPDERDDNETADVVTRQEKSLRVLLADLLTTSGN